MQRLPVGCGVLAERNMRELSRRWNCLIISGIGGGNMNMHLLGFIKLPKIWLFLTGYTLYNKKKTKEKGNDNVLRWVMGTYVFFNLQIHAV